MCAVHICTSAGCSFLHSPHVSCKVHVIVRLFPELLAPLEDESCFQNKPASRVDCTESASHQMSRETLVQEAVHP